MMQSVLCMTNYNNKFQEIKNKSGDNFKSSEVYQNRGFHKIRESEAVLRSTNQSAGNFTIANQETVTKNYNQVMKEAIRERNKVLENMAQKHNNKCFNNCDNYANLYKRSRYDFFKSLWLIKVCLQL